MAKTAKKTRRATNAVRSRPTNARKKVRTPTRTERAAQPRRWVYFFGGGKADGAGDQKELLGGKGAGLAEMSRIGLPVPAGFTISTQACAAYNRAGAKWPPGLQLEVRRNLARLEKSCRKKLGSAHDPLLVSVRSGAARSMPGMMDTILNLGLNDRSVEGLARASSDRRFAYDAYRRLLMMYGSTVKGIERGTFESAFHELKNICTGPRLGRTLGDKVADTDVSAEELEELVKQFQAIYRDRTGEEFPQDPFEQLYGAISAVFDSWMADRAVTYRRVENISGLAGTAVNVCRMVFGNMGDDSGTGVCFTRDPSTGENILYGEFLVNAQGEDVVAGIRTPQRLAELPNLMPDVYQQLSAVRVMLELHYKEMQDIEFTIERGKLYVLQCRSGKRSPEAAFKIAVDQATSGLISSSVANQLVKKRYLSRRYAALAVKPVISRDDAVRRIQAPDVERLFHPVLDAGIPREELSSRRLGEGTGAVPGAACGEIAFTAEEAERRAKEGAEVILVRKETSPEDVGGMYVAAGILTATGGTTSHAAVVARGWGKCCIVGCESLEVNLDARRMTLGGRHFSAGERITLDGSSGEVYAGDIPLVRPAPPREFETLMAWCDQRRRLKVRANVDTPADAARAVALGAEGVGLCRTEHMFFDPTQPQRIRAMREMILADSEERRRAALEKILPYQREDFEGIFTAMDGRPVTVRLLDPPLHEFLPHHDNPEGQRAMVDELNGHIRETLAEIAPWDYDRRKAIEAKLVTLDDVRRRVDQLHEANPMLGHRGCRLCVTYPEILETQVRAIVEAAINCVSRGVKVLPEIMIPLTIDGKELALLVERTRAIADGLLRERNGKLSYSVGTMIETPRAAVLADTLAETAEFFSFGTNDLTQMTMGLSRDDAGRFLPDYLAELPPSAAGVEGAIFSQDPFQTLDAAGVGMLVRMACAKGRLTRRNLKLGICGEHGGDPSSIAFFEEAGLDYVSCSPFRVPVARLAAAQAVLNGAMRAAPARKRMAKPAPRPGILKSSSKPRSSLPDLLPVKSRTRPGSQSKPSRRAGR